MLQRLQPMMRPGQPEDDEEGQEEEDGARLEDDDVDEEEEVNVEADSGAESTRSQLSYKPMSPKAPPLPEGLGLKREHPLADGEEKEGAKEGEGEDAARPLSRMSAQSRGREEGANGVKEKKSDENGTEGDQPDGKVSDAGMKSEGEGKGQGQNPSRGDEPDAERLDRQREGDRGEDVPAQDNQATGNPAGQQDEASKSGAGGDAEGSQPQEVIPHPGSRQASRGSRRNIDGANPTSQAGSGEGAGDGQRATEDSKTNTGAADAAQVKSAGRKASGKGTGGRGAEEEAPASKPASREKPASRQSQKKTPSLVTKVTAPESTAGVEEQPKEEQTAQEPEANNTENLSGGQEGSGGRGMEEEPSKTGADNSGVEAEAAGLERADDAGHTVLDFKPAGTPSATTKDKPASREKPPTREKPASREKVASRGKPASREKPASRGKVVSREKPASLGGQSQAAPASTTTQAADSTAEAGAATQEANNP